MMTTKSSPPAISGDLRCFYSQHGLDIDCLVRQQDGSCDGSSFVSRFIRLNPRFDKQETLTRLQAELTATHHDVNATTTTNEIITAELLLPVSWLPEQLGFYMLPGNFRLVQSECYREGRIYGMDVSSGAAVGALLTDRYDKKSNLSDTTRGDGARDTDGMLTPTTREPFRVLDLCCAPGLKLCAIGDFLTAENTVPPANNSVVVGVDVSENRIAICKKILHKYHLQSAPSLLEQPSKSNKRHVRIRVYCSDGTTLDQWKHDDNNLPTLVFDSHTALEDTAVTGKRKRMNKSARSRERKRLKGLSTVDFYKQPLAAKKESSDNSTGSHNDDGKGWKAKPFDRVLVDAECSTDGSLKHIQKQIQQQPAEGVAPMLMNATKQSKLVELQKKLASTGFCLLKPGGVMVYSTCSLSHDQNENVVSWLLETFSDTAEMIPVDFSSAMHGGHAMTRPRLSEGPLGVRFKPYTASMEGKAPEEGAAPNATRLVGGGFFLAKIRKKNNTM
jgi:16S rRNA C967 or C1407 C5-methylase (RsmB/RsmF family)